MLLTGCIYIYREREKYSTCVRLYVDVTKEKKKQVKRKLGKIDFTRDQVTAQRMAIQRYDNAL